MDFFRHFSDVGGRSQGAVRRVCHELKVTNVRYLSTTVDKFITLLSLLMLGLPLLSAFNQRNRDITQNHLWWWINFRLWELCLLSLRSCQQANFSLLNIMHEIWKATWKKVYPLPDKEAKRDVCNAIRMKLRSSHSITSANTLEHWYRFHSTPIVANFVLLCLQQLQTVSVQPRLFGRVKKCSSPT